MYVAAKGGEKAIENAHRLLAHERRGDCLGIGPLVQEQARDRQRALECFLAPGHLGSTPGELERAGGQLGVGRTENGTKLALERGEIDGGGGAEHGRRGFISILLAENSACPRANPQGRREARPGDHVSHGTRLQTPPARPW